MDPTFLTLHFQAYHFLLFALVIALIVYIPRELYKSWRQSQPLPGLPLIKLDGFNAKDSWIQHAEEVLQEGFEQCGDKPFQIMTGTGPKVILRAHYLEEVSRNKFMSSTEAFRPDFMLEYPGFEGMAFQFNNHRIIPEVVRTKLTQSLGIITEDLVEEATDSIHDIFGESEEWRTTKIKFDALQLVARLSSRVFMGKPLCRDQRWLDIAKGYTDHIFTVQRELREMSTWIRPIQYWFTKSCTEIRKEYRDATWLISDEVKRRDAEAKKALATGRKPAKKADAIAWFVEYTNGAMSIKDLVDAQLNLTVAAIHTTSEATCVALQHLCLHPEHFEPLRKEIITVLSESGWAKTSLYRLHLLDSFLKESQRHDRGRTSIIRYVTSPITLSTGLRIPPGTRIVLESKFWDPTIYPEPQKFDPYRFIKKGQEGGKWSYVSTSSEHNGFGMGEHACPGRFFVANEIKIAMCILLLKYEWEFCPEVGHVKSLRFEGVNSVDPKTVLRFRRRKEEIDLGGLSMSVR